jgi:hypothetical protein
MLEAMDFNGIRAHAKWNLMWPKSSRALGLKALPCVKISHHFFHVIPINKYHEKIK